MPTSTVENYLKAIYSLAHATDNPDDYVPLGQIAKRLDITPGTATGTIKRLADQDLVDYAPRTGARLTDQGHHLALRVLRRHRLVELFLVEILKLDWSEVHEEAEILEHVISDRLLDRIDEMLGHPTHDPHGDPIPSNTGQLPTRTLIPLTECPTGPAEIARVADHASTFLNYLESHNLNPGARIRITDRDPVADTVTVHHEQTGQTLQLGGSAATKLLVKPEST